MNLEKMNSLPSWENLVSPREEDEERENPECFRTGELLYEKWREIFGLVEAYIASANESKRSPMPLERYKDLIDENLLMVGGKIFSASDVPMYAIQMENAALIRYNVNQALTMIRGVMFNGMADRTYKEVIEKEVKIFIGLFKDWIATFQKDEFEDEWGLYV